MSKSQIILLSPFSNEVWAGVSTRLSQHGNVTFVRFQGGNTIEGFAADIAPSLDERCVVIGFCVGGSVALAASRLNPSLAGLVLISCSPLPDSVRQRAARLDKISRLRTKVTQGGGVSDPTYAKLAADWMLSKQSLALDSVCRSATQVLGAITPQMALDNHTAMLSRPDLKREFLNFNRPILMIFGQQDRIIDLRSVLVLAARASNARTVVLPNCGHMVPIEMPDHIMGYIDEWLRRITGKS